MQHFGYLFCSLILVLVVKNINPPSLDYILDYTSVIACVERNISGITFNPESGNFYVVSNEPEMIVEITVTGDCLIKYPLMDFDDTEDLFYMGDNKMLLVQERQRTVDLVKFDSNRITHLQSLAVQIDGELNKGLEGISYNSDSNTMFVVSENPQRLLKVSAWRPMKGFGKVEFVNTFWSSYLLGDYSAVTDSGRSLFLLSDHSNRLLELDYDGSVKATLNLNSEAFGKSTIPQAEGIAMDDNKVIYVVSEPNLLYVYKRNQLKSAGFLVNNDSRG